MALQQMLPFFATPNMADVAGVKLVKLSDGRVRQGALPNPDHVCFGELGVTVPRPQCHAVSFAGVLCVFRSGSRPQVSRLNTDGPVAGVQDIQTRWNRADENFVRDTMGAQDSQLAIDGDAELPIAMGSRRCCPVPASLYWRITRHEPTKTFLHRQPLGPMTTPTTKRVTMTTPASVVGTTKPTAIDRLVANRTGHESQHNRGGHYL